MNTKELAQEVAIPIYKVGIFYLIEKLYLIFQVVAIPIYKVGIFYREYCDDEPSCSVAIPIYKVGIFYKQNEKLIRYNRSRNPYL